MKKKIIAYIVCLAFGSPGHAQIKLQAIASYDYSFGFATGSLDRYIPGKTFDGFHLQWRYFIERNISLGLASGYNNFRIELPRNVYETNRGTVSAVQTRYFNSVPFLATGFYYMRSLHYVMPYVGGGIGPYLLKYEKFYGVVRERQSSIRFGLRPEVGIVIPFKRTGLGLLLNGRYNKVFYAHQDVSNLNYFEATVGVYFGYPVFDDSFLNE